MPTTPSQPSFRRPSSVAGKRIHSSRSAFTLVEVMMASFVLVVAILGSFATLQFSFRTMDTARNTGLAAQIMQSEIERLRMMSWSDIENTLPATGTVDLTTMFSSDPKIAQRFNVTRTITPVAGRETSMKTIEIRVNWTGASGRQHTRSFTTRYSKNGLYDFYYTAAHS